MDKMELDELFCSVAARFVLFVHNVKLLALQCFAQSLFIKSAIDDDISIC